LAFPPHGMRDEKKYIQIRECNFLGQLSEAQLNDLTRYLSIKRARYGQVFNLNQNGEKRLFGVHQGAFKIVELDESGDEALKFPAFKGDFFGSLSHNEKDKNQSASVITREAIFFTIDTEDFVEWMYRHPEMHSRYHARLEERIVEIQEWYYSMLRMDVKARLLFFLKTVAQRESSHLESTFTFDKKLTQDELASLIFTSRQSVVRAINDLVREGKITYTRSSIEIKLKESAHLYSIASN